MSEPTLSDLLKHGGRVVRDQDGKPVIVVVAPDAAPVLLDEVDVIIPCACLSTATMRPCPHPAVNYRDRNRFDLDTESWFTVKIPVCGNHTGGGGFVDEDRFPLFRATIEWCRSRGLNVDRLRHIEIIPT